MEPPRGPLRDAVVENVARAGDVVGNQPRGVGQADAQVRRTIEVTAHVRLPQQHRNALRELAQLAEESEYVVQKSIESCSQVAVVSWATSRAA